MKIRNKLAALAIAAGLLSTPAFAQDLRSASEGVVACQPIVDAAEKLACYEAAAVQLSEALAIPAIEVPQPTQSVEVPQAAPAVQAEATVATTQQPIQQAAVATEDVREAPRSSLPSWIPRITFGSDRDVTKEPDEYVTKLVKIQRNNLGRHFFTTEDGHVWRQMDIQKIRAPKTLPAEVILDQSIMGGIRIKIVETNRLYAVTRVE